MKQRMNISIGLQNGRVIMAFTRPAKVFGMEPKDAESLARVILVKAQEAKKVIVRPDGDDIPILGKD